MAYSNYRKGFKTREAAEDYQIQTSITPAYCPLHFAVRGSIQVTDPHERAGGRVYVTQYNIKVQGRRMQRFASYIGA